jgi:hypothetical protein
MSESWLADNQGHIKLTDKLLPGFWLTLLLLFGINTILAVSLNITNGWASNSSPSPSLRIYRKLPTAQWVFVNFRPIPTSGGSGGLPSC